MATARQAEDLLPPAPTPLTPTRVPASREGAVIRSPSLSRLASGKMAAERKGSFTHGLPALVHAHAAGQTQILASHPKNAALGALCADRRAVQLCGDAPYLGNQPL